jgi:hypothetical protein
MKTFWASNDLLINLDGLIEDVLGEFSISSFEEIPDHLVVPKFFWKDAQIDQFILLENGTVALVIDLEDHRLTGLLTGGSIIRRTI